MATNKPIPVSDNIPNLDADWVFEDPNGVLKAYDGEAIERFLRSKMKSFVGYGVIPQEKGTDGYYHVWFFNDQSAYNDYLTDPVTNAGLRLLDMAIPILEEQGGVSNIVTLTRNSEASIVTSKAVASVNVSYLWQQYNPINQSTTDQDEDATIVVSCRTQSSNGSWGAWDASKEFTVNIQSGQTKTIDLSSLLTSDATYQVRLVATGETSGISATPVTVTIVYSNVNATYEGVISTPYQGSSIQLPFRISGSVQKQLRIKINGYTKNFTLGTTTYTDNTYSATLTQSEFSLMRGAVKAEAWVAFGEGYSAETEHQEFQFIYLPAEDAATTPILAITDIQTEFQNWTRATIFRYAIYNPVASSTYLKITLQDQETGQVYIQKEVECINGESYDFDENFAMEYNGDEAPSVILAQATFLNSSNMTFGNNINFTVDNSENFAPTKGATLVLSAEKQSIVADGVTLSLDNLLQDTLDTNSGWKTSVETDITGQSINVPILSIGAGNRLTIPYELFDGNTGHNEDGVEGSMTVEFDIKVKNIVGDAVIIDASAEFSQAYTGLRFYPTKAVCLSRSNNVEDVYNVQYQEEVREHIAINIIRNLRGEGLNLVRIYINGRSNCSYIYDDDDMFVPIGASGAQNIVIGSDEADVDIYNIRVYKGLQLGSVQIQNDYMAAMPTIEDKKEFKRFNSIYNGSEIGYDLCNAMGLNTILRRIPEGGHYPSREHQDKQKNVSIDVKIFTERGNPDSLDAIHSGTFTGMTAKGQGTSAKGYYWWNIADSFEDDVEITSEEYRSSDPTHYAKNGKYYKKISYFNSLDGASQVYTSNYEIEKGRSGITKLVGKCNYASPQQSHKLGATWEYDELWQLLVNNGSGGRTVFQNTHACCYEKPFLCFYQIGNGNPVFCGFQTWGSGKGDKKTFGYDKTKSPGYMCVSGADNGAIAALFQMPWIVSQNAEGAWEGNIYAKSVTINTGDVKNGYCYKSGASDNLAFELEIGSKYDGGETDKGVLRIEDEAKGETENTLYNIFGNGFCNFAFSASPFLLPYAGSEAQLIADSDNLVRSRQYWLFNNNTDRYNVYYYNPATSKFEKIVKVPTAFGSDGRGIASGSPKITEQLAGMTISINTVSGTQNVTLEDALNILGTADMNVVNDCFIKARVAWFKTHAEAYMDIVDAIYHYCFVKKEGATDNRTKNTYPWIDPAVDMKVRWKQDDLDTIKKTDNQGRQTKPYYVLEHTKDASGSNYWNGEDNVIWTLIEMAYPDRIRNMMRDMFSAMSQIAGSVEDYMEQRYYWVQEYFPAAAYNETNRVLYEVAQVKMMNGEIDVSQDPITQAIGDQLECEKQFMRQRLPMLMSWCEYETGGDGTLSFRSVNNRQGQSPTYDIEYTAYQYIYPKLAIGGNIATLHAKVNGEWVAQNGEPYLCAPGETVRFTANTDSNTQLTMRWMHYAKSIGNIGALPCGDDGNVTISGKRLRKLDCYAPDGELIEFHPNGLTITNCRNLEEVNLSNASSFSGTFNADLPRLKSLMLGGTSYTKANLPKTSTLTTVYLPTTVQEIVVSGQPNLSNLQVSSLSDLKILRIEGEHKIQGMTQSIAQLAYAEAHDLNTVKLENISWTGFGVEALMWLHKLNADLTGSVAVSGTLTFAYKLALVNLYGNIDDSSNKLFVTYSKRSITSIAIDGPSFVSETGYYSFNVICYPAAANDMAIVDGKPAITWSLESSANAYGSFVDATNGILRVVNIDTSGNENRYLANCTLTKTDNSTMSIEFQIGFYRRIPKIGDFAYADGTFDDVYNKEKTVVGIIFKRNEIWKGEEDARATVFNGYDKPTESFKATRSLIGYQLLIDAKEDIVFKSTDNVIDTDITRWGMYINNHSSYQSEIAAATGMSSIFDIPGIVNINYTSLSGASNNTYMVTDNYIDNTEDDGFKDYSSKSGSVTDWLGKQKTQIIVSHANQLITSYLLTEQNQTVETYYVDDNNNIHEITGLPTNVEELSNMWEVLRYGNNNQNKYIEYLYPAAYGCYLYEPQVNEQETLDPQYKVTNWYLPAHGELMRMFSYYAKSRTGGMGATHEVGQNTSPSRSVIDNMIKAALDSDDDNEIKLNVNPDHAQYSNYTTLEISAINRYFHSLVEAEKPIYSMVNWRSIVAANSNPFTHRNNTAGYWSSTEESAGYIWYIVHSNGSVSNMGKYIEFKIRPIVAYTFNL